MSKLNQALLLAFVMIFAGVFAAQAVAKKSQKHGHVTHHTPDVWGKAKAPLLTRIVETESDDGVILEGQINTEFTTVTVEWTLPEGVELVEGQLQQQMSKPSQKIVSSKIKVRKPANIEGHIVFRAFEPNSGSGSNTVYNLNPDPQEQEMVETVKEHFRARGNTYIK